MTEDKKLYVMSEEHKQIIEELSACGDVSNILKSLQQVEEVGFLPKYNEYGVGFKHAVVRNSLEVKMKDIIYNTDNFIIYITKEGLWTDNGN